MKLGFIAPPEVPVFRSEIHQELAESLAVGDSEFP